jgi:tetratricopeptide (TPR) repeat protein
MSADSEILPPPNNPEEFESLCLELWRELWQDPNAQKNGRNGQPQAGVDIFGRDQGKWVGVQCKQKDALVWSEVTITELEAEAKKASKFNPSLTAFILATSGPADEKVQQRARELTEQSQRDRAFSVTVWSWREIWQELYRRPELLEKLGPIYWPRLWAAWTNRSHNQPAEPTAGDRGVIIRGAACNSTVVTGDGNVVVQGGRISGDVVARKEIHIHESPVPVLRSLCQLPPVPAHFTGRDEDLADLERRLAVGAAAGGANSVAHGAIQGMGGVGKTALAIVLAHRLKDRYPDAQLFLNLRGADPERRPPFTPPEAMQSIIHCFHPEAQLPGELDALTSIYHSVLREDNRHILLLLDNAADADQVKPLVPPSNCLLLLTSRKRFNLPWLESRSLDCLPPIKSKELLLKLAPRLEGQVTTAAELCGHMPLALEVFAGVVNDKNLYPVPELLNRLRSRQEQLAPVDAAFQVSYEMLPVNLRLRWCQLSVFLASFDIRAASAVWGNINYASNSERSVIVQAASQAETRAELQTLVTASLVEWSEATHRLRLHDLVRQFGDSKLSDEDRTAIRYRHAAHFCEVLREAARLYSAGGEGIRRGLAIFDTELSDIGSGHRWVVENFLNPNFGASDPRLKKAVAVACSAYFCVGSSVLELRLHPRSRIIGLDAALRAARVIGDLAAEGSHLGNLGVAHAQMGESRKAIEFFTQRLATARKLGDGDGECNAIGNLANVHDMLGEHEAARRLCEEELVLRRKRGDRRGESQSLGSLGLVHAALGEYDKAVELYDQQIRIAREVEDLHNESIGLGNLGNAHRRLGHLEKATQCYERELSISRQLRDVRGEGNALTGLADVLATHGNPKKAVELYERSIVCKQEVGDMRGIAHASFNLGRALLQLGQYSRSLEHTERALRIFEQIRDPTADKARAIVVRLRGMVAHRMTGK